MWVRPSRAKETRLGAFFEPSCWLLSPKIHCRCQSLKQTFSLHFTLVTAPQKLLRKPMNTTLGHCRNEPFEFCRRTQHASHMDYGDGLRRPLRRNPDGAMNAIGQIVASRPPIVIGYVLTVTL